MRNIKIGLTVTTLAALVACGGGGGGGSTPAAGATNYTGQYIDAPVKGLVYNASPSGLTGTTDSSGNFSFQAGDTVTFSISSPGGSIPAGSVAPSTPSSSTSTAVVHVMTLNNGIQLAQTLQSLSPAGSNLDVSSTSTYVANLTAADVSAVKSFINTAGTATTPIISVSESTAVSAAMTSIGAITQQTPSKPLADLVGGITVFSKSIASLNGYTFNFNAMDVTYLNKNGDEYGLCIWGSVISNPSNLNIQLTCRQSGVFKIGTWAINSGKIVQTETNGQVNTVTLPIVDDKTGLFSNEITNVSGLPNGIAAKGVYNIVQSDFSISKIAGKTSTVEGNSLCSDGLMNYVMSSDGSTYTKSCKTSTASGVTFTSVTGVAANVTNLPGVITFTDNTGAYAGNSFYVGLNAGGTVASGVLAIATTGTSSCSASSSANCGSVSFAKFTSQ